MKSVDSGIFYRVLKEKLGLASDDAAKEVYLAAAKITRNYLASGMAVKIPGVGRLEPVTLAPEWCGIGDDKKQMGERASVRFVISKKFKKELRKA